MVESGEGPAIETAERKSRITAVVALLPGLIVASILAVAAALLASFTILPSVLIGLALGMLLSSRGSDRTYEPGLTFGSRAILRVGVALLGAQVTIPQIVDLGPAAALAVAAVLPKSETSERNAGATVAAITVIGTAAMLAYPLVAELAGMDAQAAGIVFGASLHEVVQAVGAGFTHSEPAGEVSATVKLIRVACLAPVVALIGRWSHRQNADVQARTPPPLPLFLAGFLALAVLASTGAIPAPFLPVLREASRLCLLVAIVALGMKIAPRRLLAFGSRPLLAIVAQTLILAGFAFGDVIYWGP